MRNVNKIIKIVLLLFSITKVSSQIQLESVPQVNTDRNWSSSISYDLSGATISKGVSFFNTLGKGTQQQSWDMLTKRIWATEVRYDYFGRPVLQTLSAPINNGPTFGYQSDFIRSNNLPITTNQYDNNTTLFAPPAISSDTNTLGWYYSNLNTLDTYQDVTQYPYTRTVLSELNPGTAKAVLGGNKVNGNWLQSYSFSMAMEKTTSTTDKFYDNFRNSKVIKTVSRDVQGVEAVMFTDTDGNTLGAARSGSSGNTLHTVYSEILDRGYVDIHIPSDCLDCGTNMQIGNLNSNHQIRVYNLITEQIVPTTITASAPNFNLPAGFYRIEDTNNYYGKNITSTPLRVYHKVNYYDLSKNEYDLVGRLIKSTQPLGVLSSNELTSTFQYNSLGQLLNTSSPDEGVSSFKYRKDGQIRFSQNAEQKKNGVNSFSYTNYDNLGRPVESGVYKGAEILYDYTINYNAEPLVDTILDDLDGLPLQGRSEQNFSVYDLPDPELIDKLKLCKIPSTEFKQTFIAGNVSYTYTQNPTTSKTWYSYDVFGRVRWVVQEIEGLDCLKTLQYDYNPANGQVVQVTYQKYNTSETFIHKYGYNIAGQLVDVATSTDNLTFTHQARYKYNESGALIRTELADDLQGIDYVYNLNGQLKAINHPSLTAANDPGNDGANGFASDVFGMAIDYYDGDYTRTNVPKPVTTTPQGTNQYNGNIKATRWNTQIPSPTQNAYTYQYNKNNWMTGATFGTATSTAVITPNANNDYLEGNVTYDANGNIKTLKRNGYTDAAGTNSMDNFQYKYDAEKPNRLSYVKDTGDNTTSTRYNDLKDQEETLAYNTTGIGLTEKEPNYLYNDLGQMTFNTQENVGYEYNASGLVTKIKTNATTNTGDFITLDYNNYNDINVSHIESKKWKPNNSVNMSAPFDLECLDGGSDTITGLSMRIIGTAGAISSTPVGSPTPTPTTTTRLRVLPNTFTKIDLDVLVDKFLFKETIFHGTPTPHSWPVDINPTVTVRLKNAAGVIIPGTQQIITNQPAEYCGHLFDQHISMSYTSGAEEFITLEIVPTKTISPTGSGVAQYSQCTYVDNIQVQAAQKTKVAFYYNDRGQRVRKESYLTGGTINTTYYVRDVAGTPLAVYTGTAGPLVRFGTPTLTENGVYGASRIGVYKRAEKGYTLYELTDHLGNVRAVIRKIGTALVSLTNKTDYYPFGMPLPNKQITDGNYRYNFQGQEKDPETGMEAFELRLWDGRLGRWLTVDPYGEFHSPYVGMGNNPINLTDPNGGCTKCPKNANVGDSYSHSEYGDLAYSVDGAGVGFWSTADGNTVLNDVVINSVSSGSSTAATAGRMALNFIPLVGSGMDIYEGFRDGNTMQASLGVIFLVADIATLGTSSLIEGGIKTAIKVGEKEILEQTGEEIVKGGTNLLLKQAYHRFPNIAKKFIKHGSEFTSAGIEGFYKRAISLADSKIGGKIVGFTSKEGTVFRMNMKTGEFLTLNPNGTIQTFFRRFKDAPAYWAEQIEKYGN